MTGRLRTLLVVMIAVAMYPAVTATPAAAGTTATEPDRNNVVKITVQVDCAGCKDWTAPGGGDLAKHWEKTAEAAWQKAFDKWSYCNKYKLELDIVMKNRAADYAGRPGWHRVQAGAPGGGLAQTGWDGVPEQTPGGDPGQRTPDGTRYYENDGDGAMPADATETVIVHEFGHVLGLGDDRDDTGSVVQGRNGTVMVGGAKGVTPRTKLRIDKALVDRIGEQLANLGTITCGQAWKGTFNGTGQNIGAVECRDVTTISGDFTMAVAPDGDATLTGHIVSTATCRGQTATAQEDFTLEGKKTRSRISFAPVAIFPWQVDLRVTGDHASGTSTYNFPEYHTTLNFTADCQNCDEDVG